MNAAHPPDDSRPDIAYAPTDAAAAGNNFSDDLATLRAAVHELVDGLAPHEVQALWAVLRPYVAHRAAVVTRLPR